MSNKAPESITCIYCKQLGPPSREHILARSMGGDATAWITCVRCNTRTLSAIDQALAERSLVAFSRVATTPAAAFDATLGGENFHWDEAKGVFVEVKLTNGLVPISYPQLHFRPGTNEVMMFAEDAAALDRLVTFLDKRLGEGSLRAMHVKIGPADRCTTARIVVHREKDGFIRVREPGDELRVFSTLEQVWPAELRAKMTGGMTPIKESIQNPIIETHLSGRLDDVFRAVAKTAFNVLAVDLGAAFALRAEFDLIRDYILGRDIRHPDDLDKDEIAVDSRFVRMVPFGNPPLIPTEQHAVTISYQPPKLMAYVTLYKAHSFVVELATIDLPDQVLTSREFSTVRKGNAVLDIAALYNRLSRRK